MKDVVRNFSHGFTAVFVAAALALSLCVTALPHARAETATETQTVRVGFFPLGKFQYYSDAGEPAGYNVDLLNKLAESTHWTYEYVACDNWNEATALLESGAIDLLAPAQHTEALDASFDYAAYQMGIESAAIYTYANRDDLVYEDFDTMSNIRFGAVTGSIFARKFVEEYAPKTGMTPQITYYDNMTTLFAGLESGEVDAVVTNIMFADDAYKLLGEFSILPVYYISQTGNTDLLSQLDEAMASLTVTEPSYQSDLIGNYFPVYNDIQYTYEEQQFIARMPEVAVGYVTNQSPVSYSDDQGEFAGITRDILDRMSQESGIKFRYVPLPTTGVTSEYLAQNNVYVVSSVEFNAANQGQSRMAMTEPYFESEKAFVAPESFTFDPEAKLTVALSSGSQTISAAMTEQYPNFTVLSCASDEDCFKAIREGKADIIMLNRYSAEYYLSMPTNQDLSFVSLQSISEGMCLGTLNVAPNNDICQLVNDPLFISIMDKSINRLSNQDINAFVIQNTAGNVYHYTVVDFFYQYWALIALVLVAIVALVIVLLVRNRTATALEVKNAQLARAVDAAEEANSAKSRFLAQMSHEIRTPMNAIIGLTTIARTDVRDPEKMGNYLSKIDGSSRLLLSIINDVLDMSAIESEKLKIANAPFDFKQTLTSLTGVFYQQAKQKGVNFEVRMNGVTEEMLIGDELRVNQILMNLLSNAVKFTQSGGSINLIVVQAGHQANKVMMRFSVSDTGCGMSEEMMSRLFKPFEQESVTTAQKHGGSGLGLSIAKRLTEMMGGSIKVDSKKDYGTVFTVDIPFELPADGSEVPSTPFKKVRALVVDDDEDSCEYTGLLLDRLGVRYDYRTCGEEALEALGDAEDTDDPYDLCIVDWQMPDMDGVAVTQQIREIFGEDTIVIIVSAYDLNEVEAPGREAGADFFVPKPLFQSTLFNLLARIIGGDYTRIDEGATPSYDFNGKRALIAEDVVLNMEVTVRMLEMVGFEVECAENGQLAVQAFEKHGSGYFDIIFLDINMPVMNGYDAARVIRSSLQTDAKTVPVYAMTANAFTEDISASLDAGMNGHIAKPIEADILYRTLAEVFKDTK